MLGICEAHGGGNLIHSRIALERRAGSAEYPKGAVGYEAKVHIREVELHMNIVTPYTQRPVNSLPDIQQRC